MPMAARYRTEYWESLMIGAIGGTY